MSIPRSELLSSGPGVRSLSWDVGVRVLGAHRVMYAGLLGLEPDPCPWESEVKSWVRLIRRNLCGWCHGGCTEGK